MQDKERELVYKLISTLETTRRELDSVCEELINHYGEENIPNWLIKASVNMFGGMAQFREALRFQATKEELVKHNKETEEFLNHPPTNGVHN